MISKKLLSKNQRLVPGIYGGMGPMAHIKFEQALIDECKRRGALKDQDYPVWFLVNGTTTPDRTKSIEGKTNALSHLIYFCQLLEMQGADFIVMTCNTAHAYKNQIEEKLRIPIISLIEEAAKHISEIYTYKNVGILATDGTLRAKLYQKALNSRGINTISPAINSNIQKAVMEAIYNKSYGIKSSGTKISGRAVNHLKLATQWCLENGSEIIIAGCTEISLGMSHNTFKEVRVIDPMNVLASKVIDLSFSESRLTDQKKLTSVAPQFEVMDSAVN